MVDRVGKGSAVAREAILAALRSQADKAAQVREQAAAVTAQAHGTQPAESEPSAGFSEQLRQGIDAVDASIKRSAELPENLVAGKIDNFHEVAVQLKQAEISFRFAMSIRNKLIDAYREVMQMRV